MIQSSRSRQMFANRFSATGSTSRWRHQFDAKAIGPELDERIEAYFFRSLLQRQPITAILKENCNLGTLSCYPVGACGRDGPDTSPRTYVKRLQDVAFRTVSLFVGSPRQIEREEGVMNAILTRMTPTALDAFRGATW